MNTIRAGNEAPSSIMFDVFYTPIANQDITFGELVPKNNSVSYSKSIWQVNDGWEVKKVSDKKVAITKFKIDTWGLRILTQGGIPSMSIKVYGLAYVHNNVVCHTAGSTTPDGFTKAYGGTGGYNVYWYPGQFNSGNSMQGLVIQKGMGYLASDSEKDDSLQIGKHPWDVGTKVGITDGVHIGCAGDGSYQATTIGLFGGVQNATGWHEENGEAYRIYDISDHPIYIDLDSPDTSGVIDVTSVECWDAYCGDTQIYHKDKTVQNSLVKYGLARNGVWKNGVHQSNYNDDDYLLVDGHSAAGFKYIIPDTIDFNQVVNDRCCYFWNARPQNTEFWDPVKQKFETLHINRNTVPMWLGENNDRRGPFAGSNIDEITINLQNDSSDGSDQVGVLNGYFADSNVETVNLNISDNIAQWLINGQHMFYRCGNLKTINHTGRGICKDISGMFLGCTSLTTIPDTLLNFGSISLGGHNIGFTFDYNSNLETIPMVAGTTEETRCTNISNIVRAAYCQQFLSNSPKLTYLGWCIDLSNITPGGTGTYNSFNAINLTDARIGKISRGNWYFDGSLDNNYSQSNLPSLNRESVQYLLNTAVDLTKYQYYVDRGYKNEFPYSFTDVNYSSGIEINRSYNSISINNPDASATVTFNKTNNVPLKITTSSKVVISSENPIKLYRPGSNLEYTTDKELDLTGATLVQESNSITILPENNEIYYLIQDTPSKKTLTVDPGNTFIEIPSPLCYDPGISSVSSAELHCPIQWKDKITDQNISDLAAKGWTVFIGSQTIDEINSENNVSEEYQLISGYYNGNPNSNITYTKSSEYFVRIVPKQDNLAVKVARPGKYIGLVNGTVIFTDDKGTIISGIAKGEELSYTEYTQFDLVFPEGATKAYVNSASHHPPVILKKQ